jgi:hypothetical protein
LATISVDDQALTDLGHQPHATIPTPKISCHVCRHALSCSTDHYGVTSFGYATRALPTNENLLGYHFPGLFRQTLSSSSVLDVKQTSFVKLQQFPATTPEAKAPHSNVIRILAQRAEYLQLTVDQQNLVPKPRITDFQQQPARRQQSGTQGNVPHQLQISEIIQESQMCTFQLVH